MSNEVTTTQQADDIIDLPHPATSTSALVLDGANMDSMMRAAKIMASGRATIPRHLQNNEADCMAVIMQSMQWQMNPFAVAQKTHVTQGGQLGYEGQLVNAVIISKLGRRPDYEFLGDWSKILGRVKEMKSDKGGKYYVADWNKADEDGLGVRCWMVFPGESEPREITVMMSQAYPRFSTQWATDPQQQICFLAVRKLARRHAPDVILGVYTKEELEGGEAYAPPRERDITPRTAAEFAQQAKPQPASAVNREQLLRDLEMIARSNDPAHQRVADLAKAWNDIGKDGRAAVGADEIKRLKALAAAEDAQPNTSSEQPQCEVGIPSQGAAEAGPPSDGHDDNPFEGAE
ncbi:RecT family recombinase [Bordetella bronchialis]|uniref:RecT family recombinase n=1 Tax=Bordetella bronchialis TaxID=463025 RepID=UPI003D083478